MYRTTSSVAPEATPEAGYRNLVAAVFLRALADLRDPTWRADATFWLSHPAVHDLAMWIDFELPAGITNKRGARERK